MRIARRANRYGNKLSYTIERRLEPLTSRKHESMLRRLSDLHQSRLQQSASLKSDSDTKSFLNRFAESRNSIENELDRCSRASDPESRDRLKSDLEKVSAAIADLEKLVAESSYFLPAYEVRSSLDSISQLKESLDVVNAKLLPRKRFAFKNKVVNRDSNNVLGSVVNAVSESGIGVASNEVLVEKPSFRVCDSPGFRNKEGEVLVKRFDGEVNGDFTLSDLRSCEVRLIGRFRALFIHRLRDCKVFVGPVLGSILIEEVEGCLFMLASHQIRIHHARESDLYLRVRSRPIIEDSNGVRFAPYRLCYEGIERDLKDSGLDEETGNWENVDDFRWLRAVQSPNWSVLPEEERVPMVNV
ncbi:hypothetical protein Scep_018540 [Stephania cephalantha]|uniref:C-CAP/cofactor C-like domain-containing protein n=1 Tax=Stephania cephalantha TaxID=152367 RepID=A0AAP0I949_9MAGN